MAVGLRGCYRAALDGLLRLPRLHPRKFTSLQQTRPRFLTTTTAQAAIIETSIRDSSQPFESVPPTWSEMKEKTRLVPVSPSYFTGNADFFDNWLALQELLRRHQTLPTIPKEEAPNIKWRTLPQYVGIVGRSVKAAKYKKIVNILDRLNCIDPSLVPEEVTAAINMYKRDMDLGLSQAKEKTLDELGRAYAVGRRKTSVAKVWILEGDGRVIVNGKSLARVFERVHDRESAVWPLIATSRMNKYNVWAMVEGGGKTGQAEALTLGVGRALLIHEPALKPALRRVGCVTRDPRMVERKKPGHLKARKMPTWVKR